ncbi:hypothetical protein HDV02_001290 [Globomyces sp. JEL0801]|nr:hypothetical protein HDV02_001290 [Globomyces sp. JEL0801]
MLVWLLMVPVFAEFKFIVGSLWFYSNCSNSFLPDKQVKLIPNTPIVDIISNHQYDIQLNVPIYPKIPLHKLNWNYPTNAIQLDFYLNNSTQSPYATITGPSHQSFLDIVCDFNPISSHTGVSVVKHTQFDDSLGLFLSTDSYVVASLTGNSPE